MNVRVTFQILFAVLLLNVILSDDSPCWSLNGRCQYTSEPCQQYRPGYCAGPTNRQCCVKGQDYLCQKYHGMCYDVRNVICRGEYFAGYCGGGLNRKCCRNSVHFIPGG
ncbi:uncharacterized protein LOC111132150 [Crassostrea virginica]